MQKKILVTMQPTFYEKNTGFFVKLQEAGYDVTPYITTQPLDETALKHLLKDVNVFISGLGADMVTADVINVAERLEILCAYGTGYNQFDVEAATKKGVLVAAALGVNARSAAELAMGLILTASRRISESDRMVKNGRYLSILGNMISGKTLGIMGAGRIGAELAHMASRGFGMRLLIYDVYESKRLIEEYGATFTSLEVLLANSDYVSVHVPLTDSTFGMIGLEQFKLMKSTAFIINAARGGVVDELALCTALKQGIIAGAGVDVYTVEPPPSDDPLLQFDNVVTTAHLGGSTVEAIQLIGDSVATSIRDYYNGEKNANFINWDELEARK